MNINNISTPSPQPLEVILVEPIPMVLKGVRDHIEQLPELRVVGTAQTYSQARTLILAKEPDAVVLDPALTDQPGETVTDLERGLQLMSEIRSRSTRTKIIVLTMDQSVSAVRRILQAGATGFLFKCDALNNIGQVIRDLCHEEVRSYLSPTALNKLAQSLSYVEPEDDDAPGFTPRELEILKLVVSGKDSKCIADDLGISVRTVNTHRSRILQKAHVRSFYQLVDYARQIEA